MISPGGSHGTIKVMWAGTPAAATGSCSWRHRPTTASASGTGTSTALWVRPLLVPALMVPPTGLAGRPPLTPGTEHLGEQRRDGDVHLVVGAATGIPIGTPAAEAGRVPEPLALQVLVGGFDHQVGAEQLEAEVLAGVPAAAAAGEAPAVGRRVRRPAGPVGPRMVGGVAVGSQLLRPAAGAGRRERRR